MRMKGKNSKVEKCSSEDWFFPSLVFPKRAANYLRVLLRIFLKLVVSAKPKDKLGALEFFLLFFPIFPKAKVTFHV